MIFVSAALWIIATGLAVRRLHQQAVCDSLVEICDLYIDERQNKSDEDFWISCDSWQLWRQANIKGVL